MGTLRPSRRGFTLVEAIATMAIISTLGSVAALVTARATDSYKAAANTAQLQTELSAAMDRVERTLRGIRRKTGVAAADISATTAPSISWNAAGGACSLTLTSGQLVLAENGGAGAAILTDVSAFTVQCYDQSGIALGATLSGASCEAIRRVVITATLTRYGSTTTLRTGVYLRSTMTGAQ